MNRLVGLLGIGAALLVATGSGRPSMEGAARGTDNPNRLLASIETEVRRIRPDIQNTRLVGLLTGPGWGDSFAYVVIAVSRAPHRGWKAIEDNGEIYSVWWVDSTLSTPLRRIDLFGTRRLGDYDVWLLRARGDSVIVCAEGASYGDSRMRRAIPTEHGPDSLPAATVLYDDGSAGQPTLDYCPSRFKKR